MLGQPADMEPLMDACDRHGIPVLEDAAESLGATWTSGPYAGRHTGTVGRIGCFSFNGNKIATTGGGGMIVTDDDDLAARARHLTTQAKVPDVGYLHDEVGYNYRLTNIAAGLGLAQLERLDEFVAAKHRIAARYDAAFGDLPLVLPPRVDGLDATYWLYSVLVPEPDGRGRDDFLAHLNGPRRRRAGAVAPAARAAALHARAGGRWCGRRRALRAGALAAVRDRADRGRPGPRHRRGALLLRLTSSRPRCGLVPAPCPGTSSGTFARHLSPARLSRDPGMV